MVTLAARGADAGTLRTLAEDACRRSPISCAVQNATPMPMRIDVVDAWAAVAMDALSETLRVVRLVGAIFINARFTAPWCYQSPSADSAAPVNVTLPFDVAASTTPKSPSTSTRL